MARTNFSGPINQGNVQQTTDTKFTANKVRNVGFVTCTQSFYFDHQSTQYTVDDDRIVAASTSAGAQTVLNGTSVSGLTINGNKMAMSMTITSAGNDSGETATIVGTDCFNQSQSETITMANTGTVNTTKYFATVTSVTFSGAPASTGAKIGITLADSVVVLCQSDFNGYPLSQTSSSTGKNLANNIIIPKNSRISDMKLIVNEAWNSSGNVTWKIGANLNTSATAYTLDDDYFAGVTASIKAIGRYGNPADLDVATGAQTKNGLNVSASDTSSFESDKMVAVIVNQAGSVSTTGEATLFIDYQQAINDTN